MIIGFFTLILFFNHSLSEGLASQPRLPNQISYEVVLIVGDDVEPSAINANGEVAGTFDTPSGDHVFRWQDGILTDLGTLGGDDSQGEGINSSGQVVGWGEDANFDLATGRWDGNTLTNLGLEGVVYDINDSGKIVGYGIVYLPGGGFKSEPVLWDAGQVNFIGTLPGDEIGIATAINNANQIVGHTRPWTCPCPDTAFLWENGVMTELPHLNGTSSFAYDINDSGKIVGMAHISPGGATAVIWDNGSVTEITGGGTPIAINNFDQVLLNGSDPYLWENGVLTNLNDTIDPASGWELDRVVDINDNGWIIGEGELNGENQAFVLKPCLSCAPTPTPTPTLTPTPTPEPSWTVLFYLDGDNNLASTYPPIFNRLETAADNPHTNVLVYWDANANDDTGYYEVQHDTNLSSYATYTPNQDFWPKGELDTGAPFNLSDFVIWGINNYPADHYALVLDDHGSGLGGGLNDDTSGTRMTLPEMQLALATIHGQTGEKIDVLYMAMCLMGMLEDAYQFRDYIDYYVGNEHLQWAYTQPYSEYISGIDADSTPAEVASNFASSYAGVVDPSGKPYTISAVDISKLDALVAATNQLGTALNNELASIAGTFMTVSQTVQRYDNKSPDGITLADTYVDLYDFADLVSQTMGGHFDIMTAAAAVKVAVDDYVIYEEHGSSATVNLDNSHGVSIFFPANASSFYNGNNYDFAVGTNWAIGGSTTNPANMTNTWGPMLVNYFQITQPDGPDDPTPPEPRPKIDPFIFRLFLPLTVKN